MAINLRNWFRRELSAALPKQAFTGAVPASSAEILAATSNDKFLTPANATMFRPNGSVRLTKSGANLLLSRYNGGWIYINGVMVQIPAAGITLAPTGATPNILYYIYVSNASSPTLEFLTDTPTLDATGTVMVSSVTAAKTLVGMAYPITGPAWADTEQQRLVLSYYNRRSVGFGALKSIDRTNITTASVDIEVFDAVDRIDILSWGEEATTIGINVYAQYANNSFKSIFSVYDMVSATKVLPDTIATGYASGDYLSVAAIHSPVLTTGKRTLSLYYRQQTAASSSVFASSRITGTLIG